DEGWVDAVMDAARKEIARWGPVLEERIEACCREGGLPRMLLDGVLEAAAGYYQAVGRLVCAGLVKQFTSRVAGDTMMTESDDR
ncbi:MAG: hypothetical protein IRY98_09380, partial [Alicyclobacillaceae bacterium]|nr:hypothetical protein [Alicyclobacillaceae bacterium]